MGTVEVMRKFVGLPASPELHKECFKQYAPEMDRVKVWNFWILDNRRNKVQG